MRLSAPFRAWGEHTTIELPGGRAAFTTRRGGVSSGPYSSLNLGRFTDDRLADVEANRKRLAGLIGLPPDRIAQGRQVHGPTVERVRTAPSGNGPLAPADGQATALTGVAPLVLTADCLPIALIGAGAVAMVHAGWRGLAAGVVKEGVGALRELGVREGIAAAIGPGVGACCYEVGDEVRSALRAHGDGIRRGRNVDLPEVARRELCAAGVDEVHDIGLCTVCGDPSLFFSHRRDGGVTGRQAGVAWRT